MDWSHSPNTMDPSPPDACDQRKNVAGVCGGSDGGATHGFGGGGTDTRHDGKSQGASSRLGAAARRGRAVGPGLLSWSVNMVKKPAADGDDDAVPRPDPAELDGNVVRGLAEVERFVGQSALQWPIWWQLWQRVLSFNSLIVTVFLPSPLPL